MEKLKSRLKKIRKIFSKKFNAVILFFVIFLATIFYILILKDLPSPARLAGSSTPQSTQIFDRNGKLLYNIYDKKNQTFIPLSSIPKHMQEATIAIEDRNFYQHGAIDIRGILRASVSIILHKRIQGGSTLTQQLVKNSLLTQERTVPRKIKEIILAFATEFVYSKNRILEMYLNQSPYGGPAWGIETAAQTYFGKHAKDLDLAESALLAGLPQAPTALSPFGSHPELAKQRQKEVLQAMQEVGYITKEQNKKALSENLKYKKISNEIEAPHFVLYVKDLLIKAYGEKEVQEGGLKVVTTLDSDIQKFAQDAVATEVAKLKNYHVTNGASLITNPTTGEILAMVGSKDYFDNQIDGNVNLTTSLRQPGSSIKPVNYAVGLIKGYNGATAFIDEKTCFPNQGGRDYCPVNYDGKFRGVMQMRYALGNSINIPAVKMLKVNTIPDMIATATAMGITTFKSSADYGLSLTLGGGEVKMLDMATAFGVFANGGYRIDIHPILEITNKQGKILEKYDPPKSPIFGKKVLPQGVSFIISDILADNGARVLEFGENSALKIKGQTVSAKTGTTNDFRDNWTIGYTPSFVVATWVGNNDNTPMNGLASGITGAAPIWNIIMSYLLKDKPQQPIQRPENVIQKEVCSASGLLPQPPGAPGRCPTRFEYFIKGTEPKKTEEGLQKVWVDKTTQDLPKPGQTDNLELKDHQIIEDPAGSKYCITCPHPTPSPLPTPAP